jgi:hypothetical protein
MSEEDRMAAEWEAALAEARSDTAAVAAAETVPLQSVKAASFTDFGSAEASSAGEPRMIGSGDVWVVMVPLRYGDETHHYVGVYELHDGKVAHSTEYFGAPFPAQEFRAKFVDKG